MPFVQQIWFLTFYLSQRMLPGDANSCWHWRMLCQHQSLPQMNVRRGCRLVRLTDIMWPHVIPHQFAWSNVFHLLFSDLNDSQKRYGKFLWREIAESGVWPEQIMIQEGKLCSTGGTFVEKNRAHSTIQLLAESRVATVALSSDFLSDFLILWSYVGLI